MLIRNIRQKDVQRTHTLEAFVIRQSQLFRYTIVLTFTAKLPAMALTIIDEYEVMYSANKFPPRIWLKNSGKYIGQLIFEADGSALPADNNTGGQVYLYYHLHQYAHCVDLLRNEKPMYLLFVNGTGAENGIKTTAEVVGEGE